MENLGNLYITDKIYLQASWSEGIFVYFLSSFY